MKATDHTFRLIKSLSASEKRFFKLTSGMMDRDKNYVKLFDAMDRQEEYDEAAIKQKFRKEKFSSNLPYEKNYLQKMILKCLRSYHGGKHIELELSNNLSDIKILFDKEMFVLARRLITKTRELAIKNEKPEYLFPLLKWEFELSSIITEEREEFHESMEMVQQEVERAFRLFERYASYRSLYSRSVELVKKGIRVRSKEEKGMLDELISHPLLKVPVKELGARERSCVLSIRQYYHICMNDVESAYKEGIQTLELCEQFPEQIDLNARRFYGIANNHMYCCLYTERYEELNAFLRKLDRSDVAPYSVDIGRMAGVFLECILAFELSMHLRTRKFREGIEVVERYKKNMKKISEGLREEARISFYYNAVRVYIGARSYREALKWVNRLMDETDERVMPSLQGFARLLNLLIHYELDNMEVVKRDIVSTERFLKKGRALLETEKLFLAFMRKEIKAFPQHKSKPALEELSGNLKKFLKDDYEKQAFFYFDFLFWAEHR